MERVPPPPRWPAAPCARVLILLATFASLRWGEAIALRRCDLAARTVSIRRQYVETNGSLLIAPPKSRAGVRTVAFPATLGPELRQHLDAYAGPDSTALVFTGQRGGVLRRGNFRKASGWSDAVAAIGLPGLHFHDLRHTREHVGGPGRGEPGGPESADGPRQRTGRDDLPARGG